MSRSRETDPYRLDSSSITPAPANFRQKLKYLGPGFILSASVVGSGELIATTTLGAKAGFVTLWVILVSCLVKVVLQLEFGRQSITRGVSAMNLMNELPGPRFGKQRSAGQHGPGWCSGCSNPCSWEGSSVVWPLS